MDQKTLPRVLVAVSDEQYPIFFLVSTHLKRAGYEAVRAKNIEDAVDAFTTSYGKIKLVITDGTLDHKGDGEKLIAFIHMIANDFPCLLLSGGPEISLPAKNDAFLLKPFTGVELIAVVNELIVKAEARTATS